MSGEGLRGWGARLYAAVLDATRVGLGTSVLDLGCGAGLFARAAADRGARVTGSDTDRVAVELAAAERAGLVVDRVDEVVCPFEYADEDELLGPLFASALGRAVGRRAGPVALRTAVLDRLAPYRTEAGGYRLENLLRVLVAHPA